jgi:hypothetical protein
MIILFTVADSPLQQYQLLSAGLGWLAKYRKVDSCRGYLAAAAVCRCLFCFFLSDFRNWVRCKPPPLRRGGGRRSESLRLSVTGQIWEMEPRSAYGPIPGRYLAPGGLWIGSRCPGKGGLRLI